MRTIVFKLLLAGFAVSGLVSCGESLSRIRKDMNKLEQSVNDVRSFQAEQTTEISAIRTEMRNLTGRIDQIEHSQSNNRLGSDLTTLKTDLSTLKRRVPPPAIVPVNALEADEVLATSLPAEIGRLFDDALLKIREGNYSYAVPMLESALDMSYGKDWSANIFFWLGVAYDGLNDNKKALGAYNELVSRFSRHERAPLALYRQANVFVRLGDMQTAKLTLKKLMTDYPRSPEVALAKEKLRNL